MRKSIIRQLRSELHKAKQRVTRRRILSRSGVLRLSQDQYEAARAKLRPGRPGEPGFLVVPEPLSSAAWQRKYSPGPPVHEEAT